MTTPIRTRFVYKCRWCGRVKYSRDPHQQFCSTHHARKWAAVNVGATRCTDSNAPHRCTCCTNLRPLWSFFVYSKSKGRWVLTDECKECRETPESDFTPPSNPCVDCGEPAYGRRRCAICEKAHVLRYVQGGGDYVRTALSTFADPDVD